MNLAVWAAEPLVHNRFEWGRIQSNSDWVLPILVALAIMVFVRHVYRRDAEELPRGWGWLLTALRTLTFYGLLVLYLQPQWRTEREETRNSRVLLVADTSLSMRQTDSDNGEKQKMSRAAQVARALTSTDFLPTLRRTHDVVVFGFDQELRRLATLEKLPTEAADPARTPATPAKATPPLTWDKLLAPTGTETRLGEALRQLVNNEQHNPISGVVLVTDGGQNAGPGPDAVLAAAREARVPVFPIGVGSDRPPSNVRVSDLSAPPRAYPGDRYTVTGYVQAQRMAGRVVTVELLSREASDAPGKPVGATNVEAREEVKLGGDGEVVPVPMEIIPDRIGRRTLTFRVQAPTGDLNPDDNQREADVEIVDRKNHVLLMAGGPGRDYQFLRSLLYRDRSVTLDILLQSVRSGASQESRKLLDTFPSTREEMFNYDCVVALDPDWHALSAAQVDLLEKWVAEQGGGLIVAPGPVNAGRTVGGWLQDPALAKIRALYPVEFDRNMSLEGSTAMATEPWALEFTPEGRLSQFLWLGETAPASQHAWSEFPGVFSGFPIRSVKPAATVLARFSDPRAGQSGQGLPYFVGQFYGSGRVFYLGGAEMWRLREVEEGAFERFYTKIIRHVSQGRLLRGSARGVLLVGQEQGYLLGSMAEVRAQLTNAQFEPLETPAVGLEVIRPDGTRQTVELRAETARPGTFAGHFTVGQEGTYRLELPIPDAGQQRLTRRIQVKVPDLELLNPQRNDALLSRIARATGGRYYVGLESAVGESSPALAHLLKDRTKTVILTAAPNPASERKWLAGLMYTLCGLLCLEWLIRRLLKLA
jgi:hypothetical protein